MTQPEIQVATIVSVAFQENTYVAHLEGSKDCLVVDPGLEPEKILAYLDEVGLVPAAILNTHGHSDHIAGNAALKERWADCPLVIGSGDAAKLVDPTLNLSSAFGLPLRSPPADLTVTDGETLDLAGGLGLTSTGSAGTPEQWNMLFDYSLTLAGNPALGLDEVVFTSDGTGGGILWEGAADTIEGILVWNPTTADRTLTLPDEDGTLVSSATYVAGHGNGANCTAGSYPLGVDAAGAVESCTDASTEIDSILAAGNAATATALAANGANCTLSTASRAQEASP